jgi:hypothetical protein
LLEKSAWKSGIRRWRWLEVGRGRWWWRIRWISRVPRDLISQILIFFFIITRKKEVEHTMYHRKSRLIVV